MCIRYKYTHLSVYGIHTLCFVHEHIICISVYIYIGYMYVCMYTYIHR